MQTPEKKDHEMLNKNELFLEKQKDVLRKSVDNLDKDILKALSHFCGCSITALTDVIKLKLKEKSLATVTLKNNSNEEEVSQWYFQFKILKADWKEYRTINAPADPLKKVQDHLLDVLRNVPVSIATVGGEKWTSPKINALFHRPNKYLYTTDIKNAYPSVNSYRVYKNLSTAMSKNLELSFPYLNDEQKQIFFIYLTVLVTLNDELPQWAPTSSRILNIVFGKTDQEIIKYLDHEKSPISDALYSRYIDDIAISFKDFKNYIKIEQQLIDTNNKLENTFSNKAESGLESVFQIQSISNDIDELVKCPVVFDDEYNRGRVRALLLKIKDKILKYAQENPFNNLEIFEQTRYNIIWEIDRYLKFINMTPWTDWMDLLKEEIKNIVTRNWWKIKHSKDKSRWRNASTAREVNGIMIGHDWRLWISQEKMTRYISFAKTAATNPSNLPIKFKDPKTGKVDGLILADTLNGIRSFIADVKWQWLNNKPSEVLKWHVADEFEKYYRSAKQQHFPKFNAKKNYYSYSIVNGASMWL